MSARKIKNNDERLERLLFTSLIRHRFVRGDCPYDGPGPYACDVWCSVCSLPERCVGTSAASKMVKGAFKGRSRDQETNELWNEVCRG